MTDLPGGFRAQQRFVDPAAPVPAEWTAPTPPSGSLPVVAAGLPEPAVSESEGTDPPPYLDLST
ncbi:MAG: MinD/ParA family protein, partial [Mycobacterium sp.]|nr:MinD/ParA family protein [Mycobacterium sp.]